MGKQVGAHVCHPVFWFVCSVVLAEETIMGAVKDLFQSAQGSTILLEIAQ